MLIRQAEISGRLRDLRLREGRILEIEERLVPEPHEEEIDAQGGALLPGLHDHHLHLHALAASLDSVNCGPFRCPDEPSFIRALRAASPDRGWIRGTGYFESVAGALDRRALDAIRSDVPLRIQHRSGAMWFLNSRALLELGLGEKATDQPAGQIDGFDRNGVERDGAGRATGRVFRADQWLRARGTAPEAPSLARVGRLLASFGVIHGTDATPSNGPEEIALFRRAQTSGDLPQSLELMGNFAHQSPTLADDMIAAAPRLSLGAHKIMLDEPALPDLDALVSLLQAAHDGHRNVAIHTVTRAEIYFALAAFEEAGARPGDRLEHASVAPPEALDAIRARGLTVVTQPNFIAERGDHYRTEVDREDQPYLYRVRSWLEAGVRLGGGTDAPFGDPDPWRAMRAAVDRRTPSGEILGASERVSPEVALGLFLPRFSNELNSQSETAPGPSVGDPADLCLLKLPWSDARRDLLSEHVVESICAGQRIAGA